MCPHSDVVASPAQQPKQNFLPSHQLEMHHWGMCNDSLTMQQELISAAVVNLAYMDLHECVPIGSLCMTSVCLTCS